MKSLTAVLSASESRPVPEELFGIGGALKRLRSALVKLYYDLIAFIFPLSLVMLIEWDFVSTVSVFFPIFD